MPNYWLILLALVQISCATLQFTEVRGDECKTSARNTDNLILKYEFRSAGERLGRSRMPPMQLEHLVLSEETTGSTLYNILEGMCEGSSRVVTWNDASSLGLDFSPLLNMEDQNEVEVLELRIGLMHVTSQWDFDIFQYFRTDNMSALLTFMEEHRGINAVDEWGQTSLMVATQSNMMQIIVGLLNTRRPRADVNIATSSGHTALHYAVQLKSTDTLRALLRRGADPDAQILSEGSTGNTALHIACYLEKAKHAAILVEYGASITQENEHGQTASDMIPRDAVSSVRSEFRGIFFEASQRLKKGTMKRGKVRSDRDGAYWREL